MQTKIRFIYSHYGFNRYFCKEKCAVYNALYTFGPPASLRLYLLFPFHFQNILVGNGCAEYSAVFPAGVCVCVCACVRVRTCIVGSVIQKFSHWCTRVE